MSHLNYFEPYNSKTAYHEDQLTRAFLVVLRYSPSSFLLFYDLVFNKSRELAIKRTVEYKVPYLSQLDFTSIKYDTQRTDISDLIGQTIISVLITDDFFEPKGKIKKSKRGARYDGIINISDSITLLIENKPNSYNVWEEQLNPNLSQLSNDINLIEVPAIIEWKSIISKLNEIKSYNNVQGTEKLIIEDFLDYIDRNYPFLNPFDNFSLCKRDESLLKRRIKNILSEILVDEKYLGYQSKWSTYFIETGLDEIRMVGLVLHNNKDTENYELRISMYYGDTLNQARSYYKRDIPFSQIENLLSKGWVYFSNFHISSINSHLIWFDTESENDVKYYNYWLNNQDEIKQYSKNDFLEYLAKLENLNLLVVDKEKHDELKTKLINTNRSTVNVCPNFCVYYKIELEEAEKLDMSDDLRNFLTVKIREGLSILDKEISFLKNAT